MTLYTFVREVYPIKNIVRLKSKDPNSAIMEADDLPYDIIGPDESGIVTKLVELSPGSYIPVVELLSYSKEDIDTSQDVELKDAWTAYMSMIDTEVLNTADVQQAVTRYKELKTQEKAKCIV